MPEPTRAFGYICPSCGKPVYGERTHFALCASAIGLVCDCGHSELTAEPMPDHYRVTVPCGVCGGEHRAEIPAEKLLHGGGVGLACPETRQLCCYIGDVHQVQRALRDLEIAVQKKKDAEDSSFIDDVIMYEAYNTGPSHTKPMMRSGLSSGNVAGHRKPHHSLSGLSDGRLQERSSRNGAAVRG